MTMITPSYLGDTIEYSSYASNALGALPYGRPAGGREFTSDYWMVGRWIQLVQHQPVLFPAWSPLRTCKLPNALTVIGCSILLLHRMDVEGEVCPRPTATEPGRDPRF